MDGQEEIPARDWGEGFGMPTDDLLYIHKSGKRINSWDFAK
jgi:hypothetical protein